MYTSLSHKGFTLVETLVAIVVLSLSVTGPLFIAQRSTVAATTARDKTIATFLAQEGIEYVRSVRDDNYLSGKSWLQTITPTCSGADGCRVDPVQESITACTGACPNLNLNTQTKLYSYQSGGSFTPTKFKRTIRVRSVSPTEITVTAVTQWNDRGSTRSVTLQENLFNWL